MLRPEDVFFTVENDGKWNFVSEEQAKGIPDVAVPYPAVSLHGLQRGQIENFPARNSPLPQ